MVEEELDGIENLVDFSRLMLIDEECWNLKVVVDGEQVTRYNNRKKSSEVLEACSLYNSVTNAIYEIEVSMIFIAVTFFSRQVVNKFPDPIIEITLT